MLQKHRILSTKFSLVLALTFSLGLGICLNAVPAFAATSSSPNVGQGRSGENVYSLTTPEDGIAVQNYRSSHQLTVDGTGGQHVWNSLLTSSHSDDVSDTGVSTLWGVDSTSTISSSLLGSVKSDYGKPDFVGRYLDQETGYVDGLTSSEASYIHGQSIRILLIESDHGGDTGSSGTTKGNEAVQQAKALGVPKGVTLIADIESSSAVDSAFIQKWYAAVSGAGYKPGYYANPLSGSSYFNSAFCASGTSVISNSVIYSSEWSSSATTKASAPTYAPVKPTCGGQTLAWQYALSGTAQVNADFDEVKSSLPLW